MRVIRMLMTKSRLPEYHPVYTAAVSALVYVVIASVYIWASGRIAAAVAGSVEELKRIEALKGYVFVAVTGLLFFFFSLGWWRKTRKHRDLLLHSERRNIASMYSAALAHDLNNLLMVLMGLVEGIHVRDPSDASLAITKADLEASARKLSNFSKRIAATARQLQSNHRDVVDISAALTHLAELAVKHPDVKPCSLTVRCDAAPPISLSINRELFEESVINLVVNAAQAAGRGGKIELVATRRDDAVAVEVHDNGPGIPPEQVETIFAVGFTTKKTGSGLGLLSLQAFAALCRADIEVGQSPLGGAVFKLVMPAKPAPDTQGGCDA